MVIGQPPTDRRFGVFELTPSSEKLLAIAPAVVSWLEQAARILLLLLDHAGQMFTREEFGAHHLLAITTPRRFDHSLKFCCP